MRLRVATYNVRSLRGGIDEPAAVLAAEQPDVALVQECGSRWSLRRFAQAVGMEASSSHGALGLGRVRNAVLSRGPWRVASTEAVRFSGRGTPRGFLAVHLRRMDAAITAVSAHLGLTDAEREGHARELTDRLAGVEGAVILGLDLNDGPGSAPARWIAERLFDVFAVAGRGAGETFPARLPTARIDYLFAGRELRPLRAWVGAGPGVGLASDHRPVVADLET